MGTMVIISGRSSLADAKSNDNLLPGDAFHIHNTITNTITVMKVIHHHLHHIVGDALHLHEPRCLQLCLWMVLWIPFAGLFGISSSATLSSYSSNCFNYIDVKSSSGLDRLGGGLVIRRVGNGSEFCLCIIIDSHLKETFSKVRGLVSKLPKKLLAATDGLG